jgi:hypothetical protein
LQKEKAKADAAQSNGQIDYLTAGRPAKPVQPVKEDRFNHLRQKKNLT